MDEKVKILSKLGMIPADFVDMANHSKVKPIRVHTMSVCPSIRELEYLKKNLKTWNSQVMTSNYKYVTY